MWLPSSAATFPFVFQKGLDRAGGKTVIQELSFRQVALEAGNWTQREERRKLFRYKVALPLRAQILAPSNGTDCISGETRNISAWGLYFLADQPVPPGTKLTLAVALPHKGSEDGSVIFRVRAQVVRSEDIYEGGKRVTGIGAEIERYCA
jgi:PilZ domain-containing protein